MISLSQILKEKVNWQLKIDRMGIQVFQYQQKGFNQKHSKGLMVLCAQPEQVLKLMADLSLCDQWLYGCLSAEQFDGGLIHMVFRGPMWFKNRDVVLRTNSQQIPNSDQWQVTSHSQAAKKTSKEHHYNACVRITHTQVSWLITPIDSNQVQINYELYIDPEISMKSGVNKYNRDAMFLTLRNIRKLLLD